MKRFAGFAILVLVLIIAAIVVATVADRQQPAAQQQPTTQPKHPFWSLTATEKRKLLVAASTLKAGAKYEEVIAAMGKPTYDRQLVPKGSNISHGRSLRYQAVVWEENLSNEFYDESVFVVLDTHDVVREVAVKLTVSE